jgi:transcriptional regulator with XRE-family HTH domain
MNNLKLLRSQKGLSQQKLADLIGTSQQSIHKYENGISEPDIYTLKKLSEVFDTSVDYIVGNTENPRRIDFYIESDLTEQELHHMRLYRHISKYRQKLIDMILEDYTDDSSFPFKKTRHKET